MESARRHDRNVAILAVFLVLVLVGVAFGVFQYYSNRTPPKGSVNSPKAGQYWATFYYPWYCDASCPSLDMWRHWNSSGYSPPNSWASRFLPDNGSGSFDPASELYSSLSTTVINRDLTWMADARFNFTLVSWWGQNSFEDNAFRLMLAQARDNATLHLKLAAYYELEGKGDPTVDQIVGNLTYIYENRANFTSYFRIGPSNLPVVFVYADQYDSSNYADRWSTARSLMTAKGEPMFIVLKVFDGYTQYATAVDGWYQYRPDVNVTSANSFPHYELQPGYSALATPGFWSFSEASPRLDRNATGFALAVRTIASLRPSEARFLLIETFNEWHEGTQVEPGVPVNTGTSSFTQAGPSYGFTYLDIIRNRGQIS